MTVTATSYAPNEYIVAVPQSDFDYDFTIQDEDHLLVYVDGVLQSDGYTLIDALEEGGGTCRFIDELGAQRNLTVGTIVTLSRATAVTQQQEYSYPATTHEEALDKLTFIAQELAYAVGVSDVVLLTQAVAAAQAAANTAQAAQAAAESAEDNAELAETNAGTAAALAAAWASEDEDVEVVTGEYSAKHWAAKAQAAVDIEGVDHEFTQAQWIEETTLNIVTDAITQDFIDNQVATVLLTGDLTVNMPTNIDAGGALLLRLKQDGTGGHTVSYNASIDFGADDIPEMPGTAGAEMILTFYSDGTKVYAQEYWRSE